MNKYNKAKFKAIKSSAEVDEKQFNYLMQKLGFRKCIGLAFHVKFKSRRGCLFLSCIDKGMSVSSSYGYAFKEPIEHVANMLDIHGWQISFGKLD